ncbi:protein TONSOKU isoform X1 [Jatropha curcas]|uniref:protein TONSOKU isoform X1 n=1 Tax=Jatropha curcas TaxID=180498 RepID=UPI0005FC1864|nr:protein TONSOKU isoform X1 [Jatropha curcas]
MGKEDGQLSAAKRAYRSAKEVGNRQEEARWANVIGDILKNRGEYVQAIKWLRIDYDISSKYLPEKHLLPTCQSLGEVYLRLHNLEQALNFQKQHLDLAKDANDIIEQQRASTQLGRTYHELFLQSNDNHCALRNAKKYFKLAMKLAQTLKENPPADKCSFLKEYIDAHNNIGMIELDLDNLVQAEKILTKGLNICDEEEVSENDDGRSRLHHNLGNVYLELREWDKAKEHIEKDIIICNRIGHCQGEAKGYINLGELHYRIQKYEKALCCYRKALELAKSMEDEDALAKQSKGNIETVKAALSIMDELKKEEQNLKKLTRNMENAIGTPHERKLLLQQCASLDCLIEKSSMIGAWNEHCRYAELKKKIATKLCDKEKIGDSFLVLGESYQKLRDFDKAIECVIKSWETYTSIGNSEGQALAKISIGNILDSIGDWLGALNAFEESYRIAVEAKFPSIQLSALENMHYSHMIRFDNAEEARRLNHEIVKLEKQRELEMQNFARDCCSETDTDGDNHMSDILSNASDPLQISKSSSTKSKFLDSELQLKGDDDDVPLTSFFHLSKSLSRKKPAHGENSDTSYTPAAASKKCMSKRTSNQQTVVGRKRVRMVVLSDDEDEMYDEDCHTGSSNRCLVKDVADEFKKRNNMATSGHKFQDLSRVASECAASSCSPVNIEKNNCSDKSLSPKIPTHTGKVFRSLSAEEVAFASDFATSGSNCDIEISGSLMHKHNDTPLKLHNSANDNCECIMFRIDDVLIKVDGDSFLAVDGLNIESMKVELACLYYLQLPKEKRSKGLLPIIHHMKCAGKVLESLEAIRTLKEDLRNLLIEVSVNGWVQKRLMQLYIDICNHLSEAPNMKLLKKLYISEVEDEIIVSECELQDVSITPLLNALHTHKAVAMLDLSHNLLGNGTMEKLQQFFTSGQRYGDLALDLHCNRFGPTALFQICECPVLFTRLEVLNVSGNRLTDACGSYLSTILENCRALYSLNIERCSITSRTIQKVADALNSGLVLAQLAIGHNNPLSGNAITNLLEKLATLKSFAELNLNGLKIKRPVIDSLCQLSTKSCLSRLMLGSTGIGTDGAVQLMESLFSWSQESVKLDLSYCGLRTAYIHKLNTEDTLICGIIELNLEGNPILQEGTSALVSLLMNPQCSLKVLVLNKCQLGLTGVLQVIQALSENDNLEKLYLADNAEPEKNYMLEYNSTAKQSSDILQQNFNTPESSSKMIAPKEVDSNQQVSCSVNTDCNQLEVADSEDKLIGVEAGPEVEDSCTSSCQKDSSSECQFIQDLSTAISMANHLQLLDISNNGFSNLVAEALYKAWSSRVGTGSAWKHIKDQIIHFSTEMNKCCRLKPCCRRD